MSNSKFKIFDELFFHEDDYLQIEIIPKDNFFQKSKNISETEYNYSEHGFTDIIFRESNKVPTLSLEITKKNLVSILKKHALAKFDKIYSGYGSTTNILQKRTQAFGYEDYAILFDYDKSIVKNIWLIFDPDLHLPFHNYRNLTKVLIDIGKIWNLILIDWNEDVIVDLKSKEKITHYLNSL